MSKTEWKMRLLLWASALALSASKPPHVIFNVIDDWGYNDVGFHSSAAPGADVITPYIDSLAQGGAHVQLHRRPQPELRHSPDVAW